MHSTDHPTKASFIQFLTILLMGILAGAEIDLFVPSFPELRKVFHLSPFMVELTLGVNLAAHCITSLIAGNLGDRYGRKPIILWGLLIFIIGSLLCMTATHFGILLIGRLLQGIGISGPAVLSYLVIADMYSMKDQQRIIGMFNGVITFAMAFAPVIGSYVGLLFHWQGNFMLLFILGVLSLILSMLFIPNGKKSPEISLSLREYYAVFQSRKALYYISTICLLVMPYWIFIGIAPVYYIDDLGVTLHEFGFYQGAMALLFSVISFTTSFFIKRFGQNGCLKFSMWMIGTFIICCLGIIATNPRHPLIITLAMQILSIGVIFPVTILYPLSLEAIENAKGKIAALIVAGRLLFTAISIQIAGYLYDGSFLPIGGIMCLILMMMFVSYRQLLKEDAVIFSGS